MLVYRIEGGDRYIYSFGSIFTLDNVKTHMLEHKVINNFLDTNI